MLVAGGAEAGFLAFSVSALTIALLMFGLSLAVVAGRGQLLASLRAGIMRLKRWGGWVLIIVGLWLIAQGIWAEFFGRVFHV